MNAATLLSKHPMRHNKATKQPFIADVLDYFHERGYEAHESANRFVVKNRNIEAGDIQSARYIFTAHYDTCLRMLIPANIIFPRHAVLSILLQLVIMALPSAVFYLLWQWFADAIGFFGFWRAETGWFLWFFLMMLLFFGLPNRHNANDNSSGVRCVLQAADRLPEELRKNAAFVLFDHEEMGLLGSAAFFLDNTQLTKPKVIVNLDCVGVGDDIFFFLDKKLALDAEVFGHFEASLPASGEKRLRTVSGKGWYYPSDQLNFIKSVGVAAFKRTGRGMIYLDGIHVDSDRTVDETNIELITKALINIASDVPCEAAATGETP